MPLLIGEKYPKGFMMFFTALAFRLERERRCLVRNGIWVSEIGDDLFGIKANLEKYRH